MPEKQPFFYISVYKTMRYKWEQLDANTAAVIVGVPDIEREKL